MAPEPRTHGTLPRRLLSGSGDAMGDIVIAAVTVIGQNLEQQMQDIDRDMGAIHETMQPQLPTFEPANKKTPAVAAHLGEASEYA